MRKSWMIVPAVLAVVVCGARADWPQFQGPDRNGISAETGLAKSWPAEGPKKLWQFDLGVGFAAPAIQGGKVYILDRVDAKQDVLRCLSLATGKEEWTFAYDCPGPVQSDHPGSRTTPTVDDKYVFIVGPYGQFHCIDKTTHQPLWKAHLLEDFDSQRPNWGVAQSPVLYKDWVIVAPMGKKAGVVAFEKATGKIAWRSAPIGQMEYASPVITKVDGVEQVVMLGKSGKTTVISGVDIKDGKVLWTYDGWKCSIAVPSPTPIGDGRFFITGDYGAGCAMWQVKKDGEKFAVTELFKNRNCDSHCHNALLYKGNLYANSSKTDKGLVCLDLDGNTLWKTDKAPSFDLGGGLMIADGMIYIMDGKSGTLYLAEASPAGYKQLAKAKVLDGKGEKVWSPMALTDGKLLVRDQHMLRCLDVKGGANAQTQPATQPAK